MQLLRERTLHCGVNEVLIHSKDTGLSKLAAAIQMMLCNSKNVPLCIKLCV
jgi:hypothetical protein